MLIEHGHCIGERKSVEVGKVLTGHVDREETCQLTLLVDTLVSRRNHRVVDIATHTLLALACLDHF